MATFIDVTSLQAFSNIFAFLFTWIIVYAILMYTKALGDNIAVSILLSFLVALFVLLSKAATNMILTIAPWFALLFVFGVLISVAFGSAGVTTAIPTFQNLKAIVLVFFVVIMVLLALGQISTGSIPLQPGTTTTTSGTGSVGLALITDPRVFGVIIIGLISIFTVAMLTIKSTA